MFGKAILWACFDPVASKHVPQDILLRVQSKYECICTLDPEVNPVKKVGLIVRGHEGQLFIDDLVVDGEGPAVNDETQAATVTDLNLTRRMALTNRVFTMWTSLVEKRNELIENRQLPLKIVLIEEY